MSQCGVVNAQRLERLHVNSKIQQAWWIPLPQRQHRTIYMPGGVELNRFARIPPAALTKDHRYV
jgi:hypothetical protein